MNPRFFTESFSKLGSRNVRLVLSLIFIALATIIIMTIFEVVKMILDSEITLWQSHLVTILFTGIMAPFIALFVLSRFEGIYRKVAEENEQRKKAEVALQESEKKFRVLAETSPAAIFLYQGEKYIYVNPMAEALTGYSREELLTEDSWGWIHPDFRDLVRERARRRQIGEKMPTRYEVKYYSRDGREGWVDFTAGLVEYEGKPAGLAMAFDITDRVRDEEALKKSEKLLAAAQRIGHIGCWEWDIQTGEVHCSAELYSIYGIDPNTFPNTISAFADYYHPDDRESINNIVNRIVSGCKPFSAEFRIISADGSTHVLSSMGDITDYDGNGKPRLVVGVSQDITERKRAEEALRESEEKFRVLTETSPAMVLFHQGDKYLYANPASETITGYSHEELLSMDFSGFIAPEYQDIVRERGQARLKGENPTSNYEVKILTKRGEEKWIGLSLARMVYGGKLAIMVTGMDITERKRAEESLRKNLAVLARSQNIARLGSWSVDFDSGKYEISDEVYRIYGLEPGAVEPTLDFVLSLVHPDDLDMFKECHESVQRAGHLGGLDYRVVWPDGSLHYLHVQTDSIVRGDDGRVKMASGITQDITERKLIEEELANAKAQAELYVDLMGHDINNLNQIALGYLELADGIVKDDQIRELIHKPLDAIQNSSRLIDNVRKLQKMKDGGLKIEEIDLGGLLAELRDQYLNVPGKDVVIDYEPYEGCYVMANQLLWDVFSNLIGNAIKHSGSSKSVWIGLGLERVKEDGKDYCRVIVEDDGPGIPDTLKDMVLTRFRKENAKAEGKGLGLYLVKSLLDDFHGTIHVEDRVSGDYTKGARFVVMLPAVEM